MARNTAKFRFSNSVYLPYIGIAEKVNTENFRQYRRILTNTENFPVNNIVRALSKWPEADQRGDDNEENCSFAS